MAVTIPNIEKFVEDIREGLLQLLFGQEDGTVDTGSLIYGYAGVAHAFDRAHTKAIYSNQEPSILDLAKNLAPPDGSLHGKLKAGGKGSGGPKPGSKAAKERAAKAGETRRRNKAAALAADQRGGEPTGVIPTSTTNAKPTGFGGLPQSGPGGV